MPVNVDTVYQTVQALANKEQRGYLTPQEFNLFANQAQQDMFEQYFYDLNAFRKAGDQAREIGDSVTHIQQKIRNTQNVNISNSAAATYAGSGIWNLPAGNLTGRIFFTKNNQRRELRALPGHVEEIENLRQSKWHRDGSDETFYFEDGWARIQVWDLSGAVTTGITCEEVRGKPRLVYWGYVVVNEKPLYDPQNSQNFDLDVSEQADLVISILKLAGISIEDPGLYKVASQEEQQNMQLENK